MANDTNLAVMTGRLTHAPDLKSTKSGKPLTTFSIAVNNYDGVETSVHYFNWIAWNRNAEYIATYIDRGDLVVLEGRARQNVWQDKDGENRYSIEFEVVHARLLRKKGDAGVMNTAKKPSDTGISGEAKIPEGVSAAPEHTGLPFQDDSPPPQQLVPCELSDDDEEPF